MLLFKNDWIKKHPTTIAHMNTSNKSFLRYSKLLKKMGVKNHLFPLALINPELSDVDPYDPNLTKREIGMIVRECKMNPWYAFREVVRLPPASGADPVKLEANRGNIALFWLFFNHITTLLIQPRQTGKSVSTDTLMVVLLTMLTINTDYNLLTKDDSLRVKNIQRLKDIISELPPYFQLRCKTDTNNTEKITLNRLGNTYVSNVSQASPKAALKVGRGMTLAINHVDEIAFINNVDITLPAMLAAAGAARDSAADANAPYGNIFTTTAGYLNNPSGKFVKDKIYDKAMRWDEKLYDCEDEEDLKRIISLHCETASPLVLLEFNHRQLGKTDEWLRGKIADAISSGENAGADYLNIWAEGGTSSPIPKHLLKKIQDSSVPDAYNEVSKFGYITKWYIPPSDVLSGSVKTRRLVMGLDTSDAIGNDGISMIIRDAYSGEVVASGNYNETNTRLFAEWVADFLISYPNLTLVIERRSSGTAILDSIFLILTAKGIDPFKRIFNWVVNDMTTKPEYASLLSLPDEKRTSDIGIYDKLKKEFGFATAGSGRAARDMLYGTAFNMSVKYTGETVRDPVLISQLASLISKNNRIDHPSGKHDDSVIAWLLSYWFLAEAKNKSYYGINTHSVLTVVNEAMIKDQGGLHAIQIREEQTTLRQDIETMMDQYRNSENEYTKRILARKIKFLENDLVGTYRNNLNIDSFLEEYSNKNKKHNLKLRPYYDEGFAA